MIVSAIKTHVWYLLSPLIYQAKKGPMGKRDISTYSPSPGIYLSYLSQLFSFLWLDFQNPHKKCAPLPLNSTVATLPEI